MRSTQTLGATMSDAAGLLQAIRDNPEDDTPRLVHADWIDDHGDPQRAQFIRLQCEAARLPANSPEARDLHNRAARLLHAHRESWFGQLQDQFRDCVIKRGFVSRLRGNASDFLTHSRAVERFAPVLESAAVWHVEGRASDVLALPLARCVRELSLSEVTPPSLAALAGISLPENIANLTLYTDKLRNVEIALPFLESPFVRQPPRLGLVFDFMPGEEELGGDVGPWDEVEYAVPHNLRLLERLDLPNLRGFGTWGINEEVAVAIADWPGLARLEQLLFGLTRIEDDALPVILASPRLPEIRKAFLDENFLGDTAAVAVANCPKFATTTYLDLSENGIGEAGAVALAESPYLSNLKFLNLWGNPAGKDARERLRRRFGDAYAH